MSLGLSIEMSADDVLRERVKHGIEIGKAALSTERAFMRPYKFVMTALDKAEEAASQITSNDGCHWVTVVKEIRERLHDPIMIMSGWVPTEALRRLA